MRSWIAAVALAGVATAGAVTAAPAAPDPFPGCTATLDLYGANRTVRLTRLGT